MKDLPYFPTQVFCRFPDGTVLRGSIITKDEKLNQCLFRWFSAKENSNSAWLDSTWIFS